MTLTAPPSPAPRAEVHLPTADLRADLPFFQRLLGMRLDMIYPADNPAVAVLSGHGLRLRLDQGLQAPPGRLRILTDDAGFADGARDLTAPGGTRVTIDEANPPLILPTVQHDFVVRRLADGAPWVVGRAGMQYRDLVPSRLGGAMIASHIRIPDGGPVPDMVHFHKVGFQLIFCINGWVDVLYEDQGGLLRIGRGDCFIQPPQIRHRVVQASDGIEVIEIGVPAEHITEIDHDMALPTPHLRPDREWDGQKFVHSLGAAGVWGPHRLTGFITRDTGVAAATKGVADVRVVRKGQETPAWAAHQSDIMFGFVMSGGLTLHGQDRAPWPLVAGDAFVIPPGLPTLWADASDDLELLEVSLPQIA